MNNKGMSLLSACFLLLILTVGFAVQQNAGFDVQELKNNLNWTNINITVTESPDLENAVESLVNGLGSATFSISKWMAEWSSQHPTIPFKLLIWCLILSIFTPIILILIKLIIIIFLLTKEYFQNRKEVKELKNYKRKNG